MDSELIAKKIGSLSINEQDEVLNFIEGIKGRKRRLKTSLKNDRKNISDEKFVGMWRDRAEMEDSSSFVKTLRKNEWAS